MSRDNQILQESLHRFLVDMGVQLGNFLNVNALLLTGFPVILVAPPRAIVQLQAAASRVIECLSLPRYAFTISLTSSSVLL
ncbi:hypothetical protein [Paenibacillus sp. ISL-20]|uniref:hypothetical protein n=1 Tax=Paenibacillus sp. ISL-20 TaxID=2819163 RepID=UPI001BEA3D13|nr:hypothetical protein [Paenibacillus sp. ISL-20]MBT2762329.1 hypothetical protein [Paenibacillus sp. ISL-20]